MIRIAAAAPLVLALLCVVACGADGDRRCTECGQEDAATPPPERDAGPMDADVPDSTALDAALPDAVASDDASAPDATSGEDAADLDAELIECRVDSDCVLPPILLACERCQDGSSACPEVHCVERFCATIIAKPCAEQRPSETCTRDADCARPDCKLLCQGDGRGACFPSRCRDGLCLPSYGTCGLTLEPCPEGNQIGRECGECQEDGGCGFQVLGCFEACDGGAACPGGEACVDGLCQLTSCTPAR
ncbi:MAG TPA: hypothetical protein VFZ61_16960 [Polyangiales bacterium]